MVRMKELGLAQAVVGMQGVLEADPLAVTVGMKAVLVDPEMMGMGSLEVA
jgi:hypothetical protein